MSEVRLVVRESERDWSGTMHGSCADRAIAALSADPVTLEELEAATARFAKPNPDRLFFAALSEGLRDEPDDAGLVVIDLVARLIVVDSTYSSPEPTGVVDYHDGRAGTEIGLRYHLSGEWQFWNDALTWPAKAEERRRERALKPALDARAVFYGRPLLEFVARETFTAFARRDAIAAAVREQRAEAARARLPDGADSSRALTDEEPTPKTGPGQEIYASPFYDTIKEIHTAWLLTPREDLGGACPRDVAVERHDHISWDLQHRCEQWPSLGKCPPGLDESSHAFRLGGFGTHELVMYYDMVRELLWACWDRLSELAPPESFTVGDFLAAEVGRLAGVRDEWLDTPHPECHGRTPRSVIARERARLPEGMAGHEAIHDPDCPCCQMLADMPGPAFWGLDGSGMDDDFAFDIHHRTRAEWEKEQREWEEHSRRFDAERKERERLGVTDSDESSSVWRSSFCVGDTPDVPLGIRVFGIGCHLSELITDLRGKPESEPPSPEAQHLIDRLNRDFGNLRELLQTSAGSLAAALIDPVLDRFAETLAEAAAARPDLAAKCEALTDGLQRLLEQPSESDELDSPF